MAQGKGLLGVSWTAGRKVHEEVKPAGYWQAWAGWDHGDGGVGDIPRDGACESTKGTDGGECAHVSKEDFGENFK